MFKYPYLYRQRWTLNMRSGETEGKALEVTFHFKQVPIQLLSPEIRVKTTTFVITEITPYVQIEAQCRKATKYVWISENPGMNKSY